MVSTKPLNFPVCTLRQEHWGREGARKDKREWVASSVINQTLQGLRAAVALTTGTFRMEGGELEAEQTLPRGKKSGAT